MRGLLWYELWRLGTMRIRFLSKNSLLGRKAQDMRARNAFFVWFNRNFDAFREWYHLRATRALHRSWPMMLGYLVIVALMAFLMWRLPTGFLPDEDQGFILTQMTLPVGTTQDKTLAVAKQVAHHYLVDEKANVDFTFVVAGFSFSGSGQNTGMAFTHLRDWSERKGAANSAQAKPAAVTYSGMVSVTSGGM